MKKIKKCFFLSFFCYYYTRSGVMDKIVVTMADGREEEMEVVSIFEMSDSPYHYIIYRSADSYYAGKYLGEEIVSLDTNLTSREKEYLKGVFQALVGE